MLVALSNLNRKFAIFDKGKIMPLRIAFGAVSDAGVKEKNEDFFGLVAPEGELLASKGIVAAVADGIGNAGGREAAEYAVLSVLSDYYDTPETWDIPHALGKLLASANRWLLAQGAAHREFASMASTLSLLVLRGNRYAIAHVGDTRIYRLRGNELQLLTRDHVREDAGKHVLKRAVGLDLHLVVDYSEGELNPGDIFLLASDGAWEALGQKRMQDLLMKHTDPEEAAQIMIDEALKAGSEGNITAQVLRIEEVAEGNLRDMLLEGSCLPLPPMLVKGQKVDNYEVLDVLHAAGKKLAYKVKEASGERVLVLRTLSPEFVLDDQARNNLMMEEWLGKRAVSSNLPQYVTPENRHFLYILSTWHEGKTLASMIEDRHHFSVNEVAQIGMKIAKGLGAIHRLDIVHRDIRPENLHLGKDGKVRILDLGSASSPAMENIQFSGSPNYRAPELFAGEEAGIQSDLYALGVTLYFLLTEQYPYGEIADGKFPSFADPVLPTKYRPDIPAWFENILMKSVAQDPARRFEMPEELLLELERGEDARISPPRKTPLASRNRLAAWKLTAAVSILVNFFLLYVDAIETLGFSSGPPW